MSLSTIPAIAVTLFFAAGMLAQPAPPTSEPVITPSTGVRDRDPVLENAKRIGSELQQSNIRFGNVYIFSRLRLGDIGFTDQYYVPTGEHSDGLAVSVDAPQRIYYVPSRKVIFSAEVVPGYSLLQGEGGQFNYTARGGVQFLLNHLFLDLYASAADHMAARVADINRLTTVAADEFGVAGEWKHSSRTSVLFSTRFTDARHPFDRYQPEVPVQTPEGVIDVRVPVDLLDRSERVSRASLRHKTFPRTSLTLAGESADHRFDYASYKDSTYSYVAPGFIFDTGRTELRLEAGPARLRFDDAAQRDYSGVVGNAAFEHRLRRTVVGASAERDVDFSIMADNNYYVADRVGAAIEYSMTRRLGLRAALSAERDHYDTPVHGIKRRDTTSFSTLGFRYTMRRIRTGVDIGWYERESTFTTEEDSGIRWVLHLSFSP